MRHRPTRWSDDEALGLVEVIIATFILSVALLAMASVGISSLTSLRISRDREHATNAASAAVEEARSHDFDALAHASGADIDALPADIRTALGISGGCAQSERPVRDGAAPDPVPLERVVGENGVHTLYTVVTWADQPCATTTSGDLKRVVSLATWWDAGQLRTVRNETLVAPAGRGLPVPNFEVKPAEAALTMTPSQANAGSRRCVEHQLRNLGASDRYEWELVQVDGISGPPIKAGTTGWRTSNGKWSVEAHLETPPIDLPRAGLPPGGTDARMRDADGNGRPESDAALQASDKATLTFCYAATAADAGNFTAHIDVVSRFDERRRERITHQITIAGAGVLLHLQDRDDTTSHTREDLNGNLDRRFPPLAMNPLNPTSGDRSQLLSTTLHHWSTEVTPSVPGVRLRRQLLTVGNKLEPEPLRSLDFRYQLGAPRQLLSGGVTCADQSSASGCLTIWTAPPAALGDTAAPPLPATVNLRVQFDIMDSAEKGRIWPTDTAVSTVLSYEHTEPGWQRRQVPLNFPVGTVVQTNQRLRVRVACLDTSTQDCAVAFDTTAQPSNMLVRLQ